MGLEVKGFWVWGLGFGLRAGFSKDFEFIWLSVPARAYMHGHGTLRADESF